MPAAAVKRGGRALFIMTGRKEFVDCKVSFVLKIEAQLLYQHKVTALLEFYTGEYNFIWKGKI